MFKNLTLYAATSAALVGESTKARLRIKDGALQVRFSNRTSLVNLPKDEEVRDIGVKGSGRRIGLPTAFNDNLELDGKVALIPAKYGWFTVAAATENVAGSVGK